VSLCNGVVLFVVIRHWKTMVCVAIQRSILGWVSRQMHSMFQMLRWKMLSFARGGTQVSRGSILRIFVKRSRSTRSAATSRITWIRRVTSRVSDGSVVTGEGVIVSVRDRIWQISMLMGRSFMVWGLWDRGRLYVRIWWW